MRFFIAYFLFMLVFSCAKSQDSTTVLSSFEKFVSQPGNVIRTEMVVVGQYGPYEVLKYTAKDIVTAEQMVAVRIDNNYVSDFSTELVFQKALYIDSADLDAFIVTAESFLKASNGTPLSVDTRFSYFTPADVQLACYFVKFSNNWFFTIDKVFQKLRTQVPGTTLTLNKKRMQQLVGLLKQAAGK